MKATLMKTRFKDSPIVAIAANCGGSNEANNESIGVNELISTLEQMTFVPSRNPEGPFLFAVDHCFGIKGQGTVMTGTVLNGSVQVNSVSICAKY